MIDKEMLFNAQHLECSFFTKENIEEQIVNDWLETSNFYCSKFLKERFPVYFSEDSDLIFNVNLEITSSEFIKEVNREQRGKDKETDVLSFPALDNLRGKEEDLLIMDSKCELGDILICKEVAMTQAKEFNVSFTQEVAHLFVHGFLHLCGYDHEKDEFEEELMQTYEKYLMIQIYKKMGLEY